MKVAPSGMNLATEHRDGDFFLCKRSPGFLHCLGGAGGGGGGENRESSFEPNAVSYPSGGSGQQNQILENKASKDFDSLLAKEFMGLSFEDRQRISEEIHGVSGGLQEVPHSVVDTCLASLPSEIQSLPEPSRRAYDRAATLNPNEYKSRSFYLKFLRSEKFDLRKTAERIGRHFEYKQILFGVDKVAKEITFDDLSNDDQEMVCSGYLQFFGTKDVMGRAVCFRIAELAKFRTWESFMRATWYQAMVALEDESVQINGIVTVVWGSHAKHLPQTIGKPSYGIKGLPFRQASCHVCLENQRLDPVQRYFLTLFGKEFRSRTRIHTEDTPIRFLYILQTFGIDPKSVPLGVDGKPQKHKSLEFIQTRQLQERLMSKSSTTKLHIIQLHDPVQKDEPKDSSSSVSPSSVSLSHPPCDNSVTPNDRDVLFGQGRQFVTRVGNAALDMLIEKRLSSYLAEKSKFGKTCIVASIVQHILSRGGRFLKLNKKSKQWYVVEDSIAHTLVCARFRNKIQANKKLQF